MSTQFHGVFRGPAQSRQTGVGLIEVLVAVLVVSIGFLGVAALQVHALSTNNSAMARSMATIASYSILDAMRTDLTAAEAGSYNTGDAPITANACPAADKSLASKQLNHWCEQLGHSLGALSTTTGVIACSNTGKCTVTIQFADNRAAKADNATHQATVVTRAAL